MLPRATVGCRREASGVVVVVVFALAATLLSSGAGAQDADEEAVRAAREIQTAQDRANEAAQAMFDAESRIDQLTIDIEAAVAELSELEVQVGEMHAGLEAAAVRRFAGGGAESNPLLTGVESATDQGAAVVLRSVASGTAAVELDDFDALMEQISERRADLERRREEAAAAQEEHAVLQARAEAEVNHLKEVEAQRLSDAAVRRELERQRRERQESEAAEAAAIAAAQATAAPQALAGGGAGSDVTVPVPAATPADAEGDTEPSPTGTPPTPTPTPIPATTTPTTTSAPVAPAPNAGSGMVCPVAGPTAYADTWGAPRSGGRRHQGVDMMAPAGTPLVAVESGTVIFKTSELGGLLVSLTANSGTRYFYGHLSAWEGSSRSVSQGEVIGYVGATGITFVNHLHFEVHPGGGAAVNPYPYVRAVC
jgi:murein DD-endopeptidase MepM/ murein hydrolase activator NlpD